MSYLMHILVLLEIYIILALAMNLLAGYSGLLSLVQAAFYGTGAYVASLLLTKGGFGFLFSLGGAVLLTMVSSLPVIWFSIRLRDLFFILATLSWQIMVFTLLYNWTSVTGGPYGISGIPKPVLADYPFDTPAKFALSGGIISLLVLCFFIGLNNTRLALFFQAVRDDQLLLMTFGKDPRRYKALAVLLSSGICAIAGTLYATYFSYIDPNSFNLNESILIISIVLIGGLGSLKGSVAGALFYVLLPEGLRFIPIPIQAAANFRIMIYALTLIVVLIFRPYGLFGKYKFE